MTRGVALLIVLAACRKPPPEAGSDAAPAPHASTSLTAHEPKPPPTGVAPEPGQEPAPRGSAAPTLDARRTSEHLYIRQVRAVMVDGVEETWVLRWRGKPALSCFGPWTCACDGFAYGEKGNLELARMRLDEPEDVFVFAEHLEEEPELQHWVPAKDDPLDRALTLAEVRKRPVFDAMEVADWDHDGRATELPFRIGVGGACGHTSVVRLVGITKKKPKLHFFGPDMTKTDWDKIRTLDVPGTLSVIDYRCGDHGGDVEESRVIRLDGAGSFKVESKKRACGPNE